MASGAVLNLGVGGQNSAEGRARFERDVVAAHPGVVIIYFGINDALNEPKFVELPAFIGNLRWMIERARAAGIRPVLCTMHHVRPEGLFKRHRPESYGEEGPLRKIDRYNAAIRLLATNERVPLADFAVVAEPAMLAADGVHLTATGYQRLAELIYATVQSFSGGTIACFGDSITAGQGVAPESTYPARLDALLKRH